VNALRAVVFYWLCWVAATHAAPPAPTTSAPTNALLRELSTLARGAPLPPPQLQSWKQRLERGQATLEVYIEALLEMPELSERVAPSLLGGAMSFIATDFDPGAVLRVSHDHPRGLPLFHLGPRCANPEAVLVRPWWDLEHPVLVCPDSYRPAVREGPRQAKACSSSDLNLASLAERPPQEWDGLNPCRCGPNLIRCSPSAEVYAQRHIASNHEVRDTIAYVVKHDLPLARIFTGNETYRDFHAELTYWQWRLETGELAELPPKLKWSAAGEWRPRHESVPGQHAGILTSPAFIFVEAGLRPVMRVAFEQLWCSTAGSTSVETSAILGLAHGATGDLRAGAGWEKLARMPICTDCHARLDFGMQFFRGYPDLRRAMHFVPPGAPGRKGPLYGRSIDDPRGEAELTPAAFASLAVSQPEFAACMVKRVMDHVFGEQAWPAQQTALRAVFKREGTLKALMREALRQYAARRAPPEASAPAAAARSPEGPSSPTLHRRLDAECGECHSADPRNLLRTAETRQTRLAILDRLSNRTMPPNDQLAPDVREAWMAELIGLIYPAAQQREATDAFAGQLRSLRMPRPEFALGAVRAAAGASEQTPEFLFDPIGTRAELFDLSPGIGARLAVEAVIACQAQGLRGEALRACAIRATSPLTLGP
jgi:hypothetical protein